ncbi:MAG: hypothetical protein WA751_02375 [Candidatus Dormiibacterota bacterium]
MTARVTSPEVIRRIKLTMVWGVALLWLLDAALQAQPTMFTVDFVSNIMKPSIAISPSALGALSTWTLQFISPHIADWNWLFVIVQAAIAVGLITGLLRHDHRLIRAGLLLSIAWGIGVWVFGEGTSGVFTGNGTLLTGAPGSVTLYVAIAVLYLLPDRWWQLSGRFCLPRDLLALVFLYGAAAQIATPGFWGSRGTAVLIEGQASMAPSWMVASMTPLVTYTHAHPVLFNAVFAASLLAVALLLFGRAPKAIGFLLLGAVLGVMWYWGQAFGGIFSGMGTDPGSPPLLTLLAVPAVVTWHLRRHPVSLEAMPGGPAARLVRSEAAAAAQSSALADGPRG